MTMGEEDTEYDSFDDDGFDEAFADLIESLKDAETQRNGETSRASDSETVRTEASPYERFRRRKGMLSVSDLIGLDWCEMQFLYHLEKGEKKRSPAMKEGHKIHKELENELHVTVAFKQVIAPQDTWGLRFLNLLFGVTELKLLGMTREFPVFGLIEDYLVIGIIDQIAYEPEKQTEQKPMDVFVSIKPKARKIIISDVKTRVHSSLPGVRNTRATEIQLSLYRHLLSSLIDGSVDISRLFTMLKLDPDASFSDGFLAEAGETFAQTGVISFDDLMNNNTLNKLWEIVQSNLSQFKGFLSSTMEIEYRHQKSNEVIGSTSLEFDLEKFNRYIKEVLAWWDGQRRTKGVEIEEAYKCGSCDFEETCTWRASKIEELTQKRLSSKAIPGVKSINIM